MVHQVTRQMRLLVSFLRTHSPRWSANMANLEMELASPTRTGVANAPTRTTHLPGLTTPRRCNWIPLLLRGSPLGIAQNCPSHSHSQMASPTFPWMEQSWPDIKTVCTFQAYWQRRAGEDACAQALGVTPRYLFRIPPGQPTKHASPQCYINQARTSDQADLYPSDASTQEAETEKYSADVGVCSTAGFTPYDGLVSIARNPTRQKDMQHNNSVACHWTVAKNTARKRNCQKATACPFCQHVQGQGCLSPVQ